MAAGNKQSNRRKKFNFWLLAGLLCLAAVSSAVWGAYRQENGELPQEHPSPAAAPTESGESTASPEIEVPVTETAALEETSVPVETAPPRETLHPEEPSAPVESQMPAETEAPVGSTVSPLVLEDYDYSQPVPESEEAPEGYFDDAAFIGDSRTDGLLLYSGIKGATGLSYKGLMVSELEDKKVKFTVSGITDTVMGALGKATYGKVYIMLGVNELGWYNDQKFYDTYTQEVQRVKELQPGAVIYLQSILPVTRAESDNHAYFTNENIVRYNGLIAQVAEEQQVFYLDVASALMDEEGALPAESSTDGIHLKKAYYKVWYEYLQTHIITDTEEIKGEETQ